MSSVNAEVMVAGQNLSIDSVALVARHMRYAQFPKSDRVRDPVWKSHDLKMSIMARGRPIYGVTTGFGDSANRQIAPARATALQQSLVRMMGCGVGRYAPLDEARATALIRANCLARGHSAVRPVIIERLLTLLNHGVAPAIPEQGSVGASGDLVPLSYLAAALQGQRKVFYRGELRSSADVLQELSLAPITLEAKEALALLNGTSYMSAVACLAAYDAGTIALTADLCTALATEVLEGMPGPFSPFVHDVAKPHCGQILSARNVRALLEGSAMTQDDAALARNAPVVQGYRTLPQRLQNSYSIRCAPQFIGALWDTLTWVQQWLTVEINASTDNPLFDPKSEVVVNGGNFAGSHVGLAVDALRTALASVADLLDRQMALVIDEKYNNGLPTNLVMPLPDGHPESGIRHGFKGVQIACSALTAEALHLCMPVTAFSRSTECHNQDKVSMASIGARRTREVVRLVEHVLAYHLLALCQAAEMRDTSRLGQTRAVCERIRAVSPALRNDRELDQDVAAVVELIHGRQLLTGLPIDQNVPFQEAAS